MNNIVSCAAEPVRSSTGPLARRLAGGRAWKPTWSTPRGTAWMGLSALASPAILASMVCAGAALAQGAGAAATPVTRAASAAAPRVEGHLHGSAAAHKLERLRGLQERASSGAASKAHPAHDSCRYESEIAILPPKGKVALTFDDGPEPGYTELIIEVLQRQQVPGTFFIVAEKAELHPDIVAKLLAQPLVRVGSHSFTHPNFHTLTAAQQFAEIDKADAVLAPAIAAGKLKLFRYPYGNSSCQADAHLRQLGYLAVGWHVDSCDWAFDGDGRVNAHEALLCGVAKPFHANFVEHVVSAVRARHGGIVLLHDIRHDTIAQLETLILRLKQEGYSFGALEDEEFKRYLRP